MKKTSHRSQAVALITETGKQLPNLMPQILGNLPMCGRSCTTKVMRKSGQSHEWPDSKLGRAEKHECMRQTPGVHLTLFRVR